MNTISDYMGSDHTRCDALFAQLELQVTQEKWAEAETVFQNFDRAMERHFDMEEAVLFVAFEQATGSRDGPTSMMRKEHQHIRDITTRMADAVGRHDADGFYGQADTLRIMLHQHNMKEESILYVMTDRVLSGRCDEIIGAMNERVAVGVLNNIE